MWTQRGINMKTLRDLRWLLYPGLNVARDLRWLLDPEVDIAQKMEIAELKAGIIASRGLLDVLNMTEPLRYCSCIIHGTVPLAEALANLIKEGRGRWMFTQRFECPQHGKIEIVVHSERWD